MKKQIFIFFEVFTILLISGCSQNAGGTENITKQTDTKRNASVKEAELTA